MKKYLSVFIAVLIIVGLDQFTKYVICRTLPLHHQVEVVRDFLHIVHIRNPGIAFGLLTREGSAYRLPLLIFICGVAVFIFAYFLSQIRQGSRVQLLCFALLLGGAAGNLIDRFRLGEVIDFIDVHWYMAFHWPAFNVADSAISVGIVLLGLDSIAGRIRKRPPAGKTVP
jgi:signal peptidase II